MVVARCGNARCGPSHSSTQPSLAQQSGVGEPGAALAPQLAKVRSASVFMVRARACVCVCVWGGCARLY